MDTLSISLEKLEPKSLATYLEVFKEKFFPKRNGSP
jgi:hypothetical protein